MVQGIPPGGPLPPGHTSPHAQGPTSPAGAPEVHRFAPPRASLPPSVSKQARGPWFGALVAVFALTLLGGGAVTGLLLYEKYNGANSGAPADAAKTKLPDWVPIFPSSTVLESQLVAGADDRADGTVTLLAQEPLQNVLNYYRVAPKRKGFTITSLTTGEQNFVVEAKSADGARKLTVSGERGSQVTQVALLLSTRHLDTAKPLPGDELPKYLELVPGATVVQQVTRASGKRPHGFIKFESSKSSKELLDFYEARLKEAGFDVSRDQTLISAEKNSIDVAKVVVSDAGSKREVSLIAKAE